MSVGFFIHSKYCRMTYVVISISIILFPLICGAEQPGAVDVIKVFNATLLESMKRAGELGFQGRYKLLEPVIKNSFALSLMVRISVGSHWKTLMKMQRQRLLESYTAWSVATYARRFDGYSGEIFEVLPETEMLRDTVTIISRLIKPDGKAIDFHYRLRKIKNRWCIVDIQIEGISQLALTRSQFLSVIKRRGIEALISQLQDKTEDLSRD
jgi:phospholipid transport system substrate-binding protein